MIAIRGPGDFTGSLHPGLTLACQPRNQPRFGPRGSTTRTVMSSSTDLKHRLEYAGFRTAGAISRALPVETASWLSGKGWRLVAPLLSRQQRAIANLSHAFPEKSPDEIKTLAAAMWENLGRNFAEGFHLDELTESGRITFEPDERFDEIPREGPFVVCGLHLGNWEIVAHTGKRMGVPLTGVYQRISNPLVDAETRRMRMPIYEGGLLPKTPVTARTMLRAAKEGGYPAFLADLRDDRGTAVPFFGRLARSNVFPALLARVTGLPLYAAAAFRRPNVRFTIRIERVPVPHTKDREADAVEGTAALQRQFEAYIREAPEQWMWAHRKWD